MKEPKLRFKADDGSKFPDWESKTINSFATCIAGATPSTKINDYWENGNIPWMSSGEVNKELIFDTDKKITKLGYQKASTKMVPANTVVMALAGQGKTRGRVALTKIDLCTNQSLCSILNNGTVNSVYLYQYLKTQYNNLRQISSGEGTRGGLNLQLVGNFTVQVPSLPEQKKIADFLSAVDARISEQEAYVADLKERKKGFLQQIFSQKLHFKADDGSEFPEWNTTRFGDICDLITKGTTPSGYDKSGSVNFIRIDAIVNGKIQIKKCNRISKNVNDTELKRSVLHKNDILVGIVGSLGTVAIVTEDVLPANTSQQLAIIRLKNTSGLKFIKTILESTIFAGYIKKSAQTGAQPSLNLGQMNDFMFPLPSSDEQKKIADFFSALDEQIANEQAVLGDWKLLKKGLLQQMFI